MKKLFLLSFILLLAGIGCSSDTPSNEQNNNSTETTTTTSPFPTPTIDNPNNIDLALIQRAYIYCQNQENAPILRFHLESAQTKLFCALSDGRYCDALDFYKGMCPNETEKLANAGGEEFFTDEACTLDVLPICGTDGFSYVNKCIAKLQQIGVAYDGQCKAEIIPPTESSSANNPTNTATKPTAPKTPPSATITPSGEPAWINTLKGLASKEYTKTFNTIESCTANGEKVYLKSGSCPECFSILYNQNGNVMCYPDNDLQNKCPANFTKNSKRPSCKVIWSGS